MRLKNTTPGPWEVRIWEGEEWPDARISVASEEFGCVCISPRHGWNEHDAKLIAAAPDLYEALRYARRFLSPDDVDVNFIDDALEKARCK